MNWRRASNWNKVNGLMTDSSGMGQMLATPRLTLPHARVSSDKQALAHCYIRISVAASLAEPDPPFATLRGGSGYSG